MSKLGTDVILLGNGNVVVKSHKLPGPIVARDLRSATEMLDRNGIVPREEMVSAIRVWQGNPEFNHANFGVAFGGLCYCSRIDLDTE